MNKQISTTLIVVAIPLQLEVLQGLIEQNLVMSLITSETAGDVFDLMNMGDLDSGTGLLSTFSDPNVRNPETIACKMIDSFGLTTIENNPEAPIDSGEEQVQPQLVNSIIRITRVEVYGVSATENIVTRLKNAGFSKVENTELGCAALRDD